MQIRLPVSMVPQPDDRSCGPTCLRAVYSYFGDEVELARLVDEIPQLSTGGTLAVNLGCHALRRGYACEIYTYNLQTFDPSWFAHPADLPAKLRAQLDHKGDDGRLAAATNTYLEFLAGGGRVTFQPLSFRLVYRLLAERLPVLTGVSATYLYDMMRERGETDTPDDVRGDPVGHFVVLAGADPQTSMMTVADPWPGTAHVQELPFDKVMGAILLGVLTYDANLLVIRPR